MTVTVASKCPTLPRLSVPSADGSGNGLCEDISGNGRLDLDDVAEFFEHLDSIEIQLNSSKFDINGSGAVDIDDIVNLFGQIVS